MRPVASAFLRSLRSYGKLLSLWVFTICLLGMTPTFSQAQEVSILVSADFPPYHHAVRGFRDHLPSSFEVTTYQMKGDVLEGREMATRIRASHADVILAVGLKAALVAKLEIIDTPIVFCLVLNPAAYGLPTPNMVGIQLRVPSNQQLETIQLVLPAVKTIGLVYDPDQSAQFVLQAQQAAHTLGLSLVTRTISSPTDLPSTLRTFLPEIDVLWLIRDSTVITKASIPFILETTLEYRRPVFGFSAGLAQHGAIATVSVDYVELGRQAGTVANTIIEQGGLFAQSRQPLMAPRHTQLALNLGTSHFLGLAPNPKIVQLASAVFGGPGAFAKRALPEEADGHLDSTSETFLLP